MRWLLCCLLVPLSANAASVLLVPSDEKARAMADELIEPFAAVNLTVKMAGTGSPAHVCLKVRATRDACLAGIEEKARVVGVFIVSGALRGARGTMSLELLSEGKSLKKESFKVQKGRIKTQLRGPVESLLKLIPEAESAVPVEQPRATVTEAVKQPEPVPVAAKPVDAPKKEAQVALAPAPPKETLELKTATPKAARPKVAAWVTTVLALGAAGTAATFGGLGLAGKERLEAAPNGVSALSYSEAAALQEATNTQLTVALGAGIGAGVSGVLAAIFWGAE